MIHGFARRRVWRAGLLAGMLGLAALATGMLPGAPRGPSAEPAPLRGAARVLDGDTLELGHLRIRLWGIDAPELDQRCGTRDGGEWPCGAVAQARLAALVGGAETGCQPRERDNHGRLVGRCAVDGVDLGALMVAEGLAWAYLAFTHAYAEGEAEARASGVGIWQGPSVAAWHHRSGGSWVAAAGRSATPPAPARPDAPPPEGCAIKGNISAIGERVYHLPESRWYARTIIEAAGGERWFCSAAEAEAAGWRPAAGSR